MPIERKHTKECVSDISIQMTKTEIYNMSEDGLTF